MSTAWRTFLRQSDKSMWDEDAHHGMTWKPANGSRFAPRKETTLSLVFDYLSGFGWDGVTANQLVSVTGRDKREVRRALANLQEAGIVRVEEEQTRGSKASMRKVYYTFYGCPWKGGPRENEHIDGTFQEVAA